MTEKEFLERLFIRISELAKSGTRPFGRDPCEYALSVAPIYWLERGQDGLSPEQCAEEDASFGKPDPAPIIEYDRASRILNRE